MTEGREYPKGPFEGEHLNQVDSADGSVYIRQPEESDADFKKRVRETELNKKESK